jgi:hypothetical protein
VLVSGCACVRVRAVAQGYVRQQRNSGCKVAVWQSCACAELSLSSRRCLQRHLPCPSRHRRWLQRTECAGQCMG